MRTTKTVLIDKKVLSSSLENLASYNETFLDKKSMLDLEHIVAFNQKYLSDLNLSLSKEYELNQVILKDGLISNRTNQRILFKRKSKNKVLKLNNYTILFKNLFISKK